MGWKICVKERKVTARAILGKTAQVAARIKSFALPFSSSHCELHRQEIIKMMKTCLKSVPAETVITVNHIKRKHLMQKKKMTGEPWFPGLTLKTLVDFSNSEVSSDTLSTFKNVG
jgi:hypothetical protein